MLYRLILALRHLFYDKGWKKSFTAPVPTICVGNITAGGTGKTPHTEMILRTLLRSDEWAYANLAMLSRGYKRRSRGFQTVSREGTAREFGDEPLQIAKKFPSVHVAVDKNRVEACRLLAEGGVAAEGTEPAFPKAELIVLDDAFQYRRLRAGVNIVLIDYNRPVHKDHLLPWGRLRDLPSRLQAADIVIVTKCPLYMDEWEKGKWTTALSLRPDQALFFTTLSYQSMEPVFPEADSRYVYSQRLILFTGIAKDGPLRSFLSDKYKVVKRFSFPDHHRYSRGDVRKLMGAVRDCPIACVATTEKDAQRIRDVKKVPDQLKARLFYIPVEVTFLSDEDRQRFEDLLLRLLRERQPDRP